MTIIKCNRCKREISSTSEVYIVEGNRLYRGEEPTHRAELCYRCFKCWLDWLQEGE